jgi:hypothetical protein
MAKGKSKKAAERARIASRLTPEMFKKFLVEVADKRQDLDDAAMAHAAEFKHADSLGIHRGAAKLTIQLDRYEPAKRADFLRSFDQMRDWMEHWDAQPDLLEQETESDGEDGGDGDLESEGAIFEGAGDGSGYGETTTAETTDAAEETIVVDADPGEDDALVVDEPLDEAGYTFACGKKAGLEGKQPEDNPETDKRLKAHNIWERGRALGERLLAHPEEAELAEGPKPRARRKPAVAKKTAAGDVLH